MSSDQPSEAVLRDASLLIDGGHHDAPTWDEVVAAQQSGNLLWLDVERPGTDDLHRLAQVFGLHDEMVSDSSEFHQRTRLADYEGYLLVVMYAVADDAESLVEVHLYVTSRHVISVRRDPCPPLEELHGRVDRVLSAHATVPALLARILATLVGTFTDALERVDEELTALEDRILNEPLSKEQLDELLQVRRRVTSFRRAVDPARDLVGAGRFLVLDALEDVSDDARRHLRDLAVDLAHVGDQLEGERDRLSAVMDVYMNQVNNRQNRVMQQLAAVSTVFLPLTFLTGYFGMNFATLVREVRSPVAFVGLGLVLPLVTVVVALAVIIRRGWFRGA
jgi:magnesium transporter